MDKVKIAKELVELAKELTGSRSITAKVDYGQNNVGGWLTVSVAVASMAASEVFKEGLRVHGSIRKAVYDIEDMLESNPDVSGVKSTVQDADDMILTATRGGLTFVCRVKLFFDYTGQDRHGKIALIGDAVSKSFKKQGIRASKVDEVEEIEPQGSTPVKERKQKAE